MKKVINNLNYIDVVEQNGDMKSLAKSSLKKVHRINGAVYLNMLDDIPYFLNYEEIENPATPGIVYTSVSQLYLDILGYLEI